MSDPKYHYSATNGGGTWMVKRWTDDPDNYDEAEITATIPLNEKMAIQAAIERGSWA
jgi:hypothetical protein